MNPMSHAKTTLSSERYVVAFLFILLMVDSVMQLPIASCLMASFSLGYVYLYRTYFQHIAIEKSYS